MPEGINRSRPGSKGRIGGQLQRSRLANNAAEGQCHKRGKHGPGSKVRAEGQLWGSKFENKKEGDQAPRMGGISSDVVNTITVWNEERKSRKANTTKEAAQNAAMKKGENMQIQGKSLAANV